MCVCVCVCVCVRVCVCVYVCMAGALAHTETKARTDKPARRWSKLPDINCFVTLACDDGALARVCATDDQVRNGDELLLTIQSGTGIVVDWNKRHIANGER